MKILLLAMATCFWGLGFVGARWTFLSFDPLWSHGLRYIFAGLIALPLLAMRKGLRLNKEAIICGVLLSIGLQLQTIGIEQTTLAKSGFLTTFYAILTPLLGMIFLGQRYRLSYWLLVFVALVGVAFLCGLEISGLNKGDLYIIASALFFSVHIFAVDRFGQYLDSMNFNFQQCVVMGIIGGATAWITSGPTDLSPLISPVALQYPSALMGFIILSILSSLIAFSVQIYAQKETPAHIVSLIFLLESVFSAFFGYLFFNETLDQNGLIGATLILVSVGLTPKFMISVKESPVQEVSV